MNDVAEFHHNGCVIMICKENNLLYQVFNQNIWRLLIGADRDSDFWSTFAKGIYEELNSRRSEFMGYSIVGIDRIKENLLDRFGFDRIYQIELTKI